MNARDAAAEAVRAFDEHTRCLAGIWLEVATRLMWDKPEVIMEEIQQEIDKDRRGAMRCWDCYFARIDVIERLS